MTDRLLPGSPRWAIGAAAVLAAVSVVAGAVPGTWTVAALHTGATTALYVVLCAVATWRARRVPHERSVWSRIAPGTVVLAVGGIATALLEIIPATRDVAALPI
jgi:hypothetical protein